MPNILDFFCLLYKSYEFDVFSASAVTTLWRYTNLFIVIIIIIVVVVITNIVSTIKNNGLEFVLYISSR